MSTAQMRAYIKEAYPGDAWYQKINKMSDKQVLAVYTSFMNRKLLKGQRR